MRPDRLLACLLLLCTSAVWAAKLDRTQLEADRVIIGEIRIYAGDVFDPQRPDENRFLYRLANRLHVETREGIVAQLLLFKVGDVYSNQAIEESERLLRQRRAFFDAEIRPVAMRRGKVVIEVRTRDIWSLRPALEFGRSGGENHSEVGFEELNFLGLGTQLSLGYTSDPEREARYAAMRAPQIGRARWELDLLASNSSDGNSYRVALVRPFFALDTRWSAGADILDDEHREQRYRDGEIVDRYALDHRSYTLLAGWSQGLVDNYTQRYTFGLSYDERSFAPVTPIDGVGSTYLPEDRKLIYPWIGYELIENRYIVERNRDQIGRSEDVLLGWHATARVGLSAQSFGADRAAWIYSAQLSNGDHPTPRDAWEWSLGVDGRLESGTMAGTVFDMQARYDHRYSDTMTTHIRASMQRGRGLDLDQLVSLGGDNGLRGYPYRYANGDSRALVTLEQRFYTNWYPGRLFRVGAAVFVDIGRVYGSTPEGRADLGVLSDIGIGLRLANTRSGTGRVIHIDLAHPLNGGNDISSLQLLLSTEQRF